MMGINKDKKDFGITFGKWGVPAGPYLFIPLFGPTTVRDGTGTLVRLFIGPVGYILTWRCAIRFTAWGTWMLGRRRWARESVLDTAALDRYRFLRNAYLKNRQYQIYDGKPPPEADDADAASTAPATAARAAIK